MNTTTFWAHSTNDAGLRHSLREHLRSVAYLAGRFANVATWRDEAALSGLLHDIGKYGDRFQARLRGEDAGLDHWSQGAWLALNGACGEPKAIAAALAIEGHHIGLQPACSEMVRRLKPANLTVNHPLRLALSDPDVDRLLARGRADGLSFAPPTDAMAALGQCAIARMMLISGDSGRASRPMPLSPRRAKPFGRP